LFDANDDVHFGYPLSVLIANPETGSRQSPFDPVFIANDAAAATFQAAFIGKGYVPFPEFEAVCRAGIGAGVRITLCADVFFYLDMPFFVDVVFIDV
jgi:hypothetical protein